MAAGLSETGIARMVVICRPNTSDAIVERCIVSYGGRVPVRCVEVLVVDCLAQSV